MPQQSLSDFVSAMDAAGMLVRVTEEKRVDELPRVMEDHDAARRKLGWIIGQWCHAETVVCRPFG
jgi:hypothetical protein